MSDQKEFQHKGRAIRTEISTSASPEQVWKAWTDPEHVARWFVDRAEGEAKAGNIIKWFWGAFGHEIPYKVLDAIPDTRLVLQSDYAGRIGIIEVTIEHKGGETWVSLINSGFKETAEWDDEYEGMSSGWQLALGRMGYYVEHHFGEAKQDFFLHRPAHYEYADLMPYYREADRLAEWLTTSGSIGNVGDSYELQLQDGTMMRGEVLTITGQEVAVSWPEMRGVFELKAFPLGKGQRALSVAATTWGLSSDRFIELEAIFSVALDRLSVVMGQPVP